MARQPPWIGIFAETGAIVVSILLAFAIQAWWEEAKERREEQILLLGLLEDLRDDSADYTQVAETHHARMLAADFLLAVAGDAGASEEGARQVRESGMTTGEAFGRVASGSRLETVHVSYDQITEAGMSEVIDDVDLRRRIARYYALAEDRSDVNALSYATDVDLARALRVLGYTPFDGDRIADAQVLDDPQVRAVIRTIRRRSQRTSQAGSEMLDQATQLIAAVERNLR